METLKYEKTQRKHTLGSLFSLFGKMDKELMWIKRYKVRDLVILDGAIDIVNKSRVTRYLTLVGDLDLIDKKIVDEFNAMYRKDKPRQKVYIAELTTIDNKYANKSSKRCIFVTEGFSIGQTEEDKRRENEYASMLEATVNGLVMQDIYQ